MGNSEREHARLGFERDTLTQRVVFAPGAAAARVAEELPRLGSRVLLVAATAEAALADRLTAELHGDVEVVGRFDGVRPHVPVEVAEEVRTLATEVGADVVLSIGGGSTTGTAKAVALTGRLPVLAVPTTYAGSEVTAVWGLTEAGRKTTGVDPVVLPRTVVYDADLTATMPVALSVTSGLNALAHAVDAFWAPRVDPVDAALATEAIRALAAGLRAVVADPDGAADAGARDRCLYGAYLSAVAFASAGSGLHHKICHVLGGAHDLPHADTHAVVLPHVLAFNAPAAPEAARRVAAALDAPEAVAGLVDLRHELGAPTALRDLGMAESDIPADAEAVVEATPPSNPRPVSYDDAVRLLTDAWNGTDPRGEIG
ncbi:maleylacetate reductase [Nocardioides sp. CFH 31398]|uniref:maleylacetate reductase n=1 Tax=Nocardioides sp. CFH 31398 TaxID=2919579 RepID=UPI001F065C22|nr:maleylacetate reductase [Nocardioides sp. CFH 31398]MCH1867281.1 maleylacetate reductase [Nocardioides sp. CFH 31398]